MAGGGCEAVGAMHGLEGGLGVWGDDEQLVVVRCCPKKTMKII